MCIRDSKEELIKLWKASASESRSRNFWRILHHCEMGHFSTIRLMSPERVIGLSRIFYHKCIPWTRKSPLNFGSNPSPESGSFRVQTIYFPWRTYAVSWLLLLNILLVGGAPYGRDHAYAYASFACILIRSKACISRYVMLMVGRCSIKHDGRLSWSWNVSWRRSRAYFSFCDAAICLSMRWLDYSSETAQTQTFNTTL